MVGSRALLFKPEAPLAGQITVPYGIPVKLTWDCSRDPLTCQEGEEDVTVLRRGGRWVHRVGSQRERAPHLWELDSVVTGCKCNTGVSLQLLSALRV